MKVLFVNAGNETGGGRSHIIGLMKAMIALGKDEPSLLVFEDGPVAELARANQLPVEVFEQPKTLTPHFLKQLAAHINSENIDVVHTHGPRSNLFLALIRKRITAKWTLTLHTLPKIDYLNKGFKGKILLPLSLWVLKKADHIYLIAERFRNSLVQQGTDTNKMTTIFNAIEFSPEVPTPVKQPQFTMICVARLTAQKHQQLLLEALANVDFEYQLHLIGDGELEAEFKKLATDYQITDKVHFDGFQSDVAHFYRHTDLSVLSSIHEGFPTVLLESGNYGVPAITTDVGDSKVIVDSPEYGWVVDSLDLQGYVKALNEAYAAYQNNQLVGMGLAFNKHVSQSFSTRQLAILMHDLYAQL